MTTTERSDGRAWTARRAVVVLLVGGGLALTVVVLAQVVLYGRILPGPDAPELTIARDDAVSAPAGRSGGYYPTTWPSEHADAIRSHAVPEGGLPAGVGGTDLEVASTELPLPTWGYTRDGDDVLVLGGSPQLLSSFTESIEQGEEIPTWRLVANQVRDLTDDSVPYVAKVDVATGEKTILPLDRGGTVNYTGGLLVHADGHLYAVARSVLYKIDPVQMRVLASTELPRIGNDLTSFWTTYNGLQVLDNGELVVKGFHLLNNRELDGYLLLVDPTTLRLDVTQRARVSSARLSLADGDLYHVNSEDVLRWRVTDRGFVADSDFTERYRADGSTQASSPMVMPRTGTVVFADNTAPGARTPIRLYAKPLHGDGPLRSAPAFATEAAGFNFFMVAGDGLVNDIVVSYDPINSAVSAGRVSADGTITRLWERTDITASASPAISVASRHVYLDDYRDGRDDFVVLDLFTGEERARAPLPATLPTVGTVFVGTADDVFVISSEAGRPTGYVTRIRVRP
ncbi:MAG: hypothetical protein ACRCYR_17975 [Phycicoccus sp.]